jgi:hypothetical protein
VGTEVVEVEGLLLLLKLCRDGDCVLDWLFACSGFLFLLPGMVAEIPPRLK